MGSVYTEIVDDIGDYSVSIVNTNPAIPMSVEIIRTQVAIGTPTGEVISIETLTVGGGIQ